MEKKPGSEGDSRAGGRRHRDWSGHGNKAAAKGTHFLERADIETGQDMEISEAARGTHFLERADVGTSQDMEIKRGSEEDSLAGECRCQNYSGHGNKARQREGLTS